MDILVVSIVVCFTALVTVCVMLRRSLLSLGLPIAYLGFLLLNRVPGAFAHAISSEMLTEAVFTETGIMLTAIGAMCLVIGVGLGRIVRLDKTPPANTYRRQFATFCIYGEWIMTFVLTLLTTIRSLGAAIDKGGAIRILGAPLGLISRGLNNGKE